MTIFLYGISIYLSILGSLCPGGWMFTLFSNEKEGGIQIGSLSPIQPLDDFCKYRSHE